MSTKLEPIQIHLIGKCWGQDFSQTPHLIHSEALMKYDSRQKYLDELTAFKDRDIIKVATGMRRCDKSTLLDMMVARRKASRLQVLDYCTLFTETIISVILIFYSFSFF